MNIYKRKEWIPNWSQLEFDFNNFLSSSLDSLDSLDSLYCLDSLMNKDSLDSFIDSSELSLDSSMNLECDFFIIGGDLGVSSNTIQYKNT